jgi:hypothetical protein
MERLVECHAHKDNALDPPVIGFNTFTHYVIATFIWDIP